MNKYQEALTNLKTYIIDYDDEFVADIYLYESYKEEFDLLQELVEQQKQPTLEECIKEWKEKGFIVNNNDLYIFLHHEQYGISIFIDKKEIKYHIYYGYISLELNELLTKTLKALEVEDE